MNQPNSNSPETDPIEREAAQWVLRLDRQLSAAEQDEYSQWLATDPRHGEAVALHRWGWEELDRLTGLQNTVNALPDPDLLAPPRRRSYIARTAVSYFAMAAVAAIVLSLAFMAVMRRPGSVATPATERVVASPVRSLAAPIERRVLEDGSTVELNRGAAIDVQFTETERRVWLVRGEANFIVAKNPLRPFIVGAGGIEVRAVGTVFNVHLDHNALEVLVAEGKVQVQPAVDAAAKTGDVAPTAPLVIAGERAIVALTAGAVQPKVETLSPEELTQKTAWQPRMLDFTAASLGEIVSEFNRRNPVRLVLGDAELGTLKLSASFRSDNVAGFVRLMESDFGMRAEWRGESEIVLRKAQ